MNRSFLESMDHLVAEEQNRAQAARKLLEIAKEHPDLFSKFAQGFLAEIENAEEAGEEKFEDADDEEEEEGELLSPTQAIRDWLRRHKKGTPGQIVAALKTRIDTQSQKPANIISRQR